ncbi:unnamed protein product [Clonostachys byssicola]|uniref:F-box domain-containing protein n=1 Tax=Clonostachys byssicola TaxID=160290 RepID=A0A9N9UKS3_9HYPO|nr:unnamed protein product [Clonostachys byssicola]
MEEARGRFSSVPREILDDIVSYLPNRDKKALRRASSFFAETVNIQIPRVFLSANPRNIEVIEAIANHEIRRHHVEQLIWDDSLLATPGSRHQMRNTYEPCGPFLPAPKHALLQSLPQRKVDLEFEPHRLYATACVVNIHNILFKRGKDCDTPAHLDREERLENAMSFQDSVRHYTQLYFQQQEVIRTGQHIRAFRVALDRFPNLRKVTITPACHGFLFTPLYETPMIRDFPKGFNHPIPRSWVSYTGTNGRRNAILRPGFRGSSKKIWDSVHVVFGTLVERKHNQVTELEVNVHGLDYGIPIDFFRLSNIECCHFFNIAEKLSRLDLSIQVPPSPNEDPFGTTVFMRPAFCRNPNLKHFSLHCCRGGHDGRFPPLRKLLPVEKWTYLEHFGLTGFKVSIDDLVDFLSSMPTTLSSLELGFLRFQTPGEHYDGLMQAMRDNLGWRNESEDSRPKIVIRVDLADRVRGRYIQVDKEVEDFVYGDGPNPFTFNDLFDKGTMHDEFDPEYERPNLADEELAALGIIKDPRYIEDSPYDADVVPEYCELEDDQDSYDFDSQSDSSGEADYAWSDSADSQ